VADAAPGQADSNATEARNCHEALGKALGNLDATLEEHRALLKKVTQEHASTEDAMAARIAALEDDLSLALDLLDEEEHDDDSAQAARARSKYVALCNAGELFSTWISRAANSGDHRCGAVMARRAPPDADGDGDWPILRPVVCENLRKVCPCSR
jgi:hypothetical protein